MQIFCLGFVTGIISLLFYSQLLSLVFSSLLLFCAVIALFFCWKKRLLLFFIATIVGCSWGMMCADWQLRHGLNPEIENKKCIITGTIISIPENLMYGKRFLFRIDSLKIGNNYYSPPDIARLVWTKPQNDLKVGQKWQLQVRLKKPHSTFNPNSFDLEAWYFEHHIQAVGNVKSNSSNQLLKTTHWLFSIDQLRQKLDERITEYLQNDSMIGFVCALSVGIRDAITGQQWKVLQATGTNHLMAIAGLHIGLATTLVFFLIRRVWKFFPRFMLFIPSEQVAAIFALVTAIAYSALAGFALPTQRAIIMLSVFLLANLLKRKIHAWQSYILALFFILLIHPMSILAASFWLSFVTVGWIIYAMPRFKSHNFLHHLLQIQFVITIGLIPLSLFFYQQLSLLGIIANCITIPWIAFVVLPLCGGSIFACLISKLFASKLLFLTSKTLLLMYWFLEKLSAISWLQWQFVPNDFVLLIAILGLLLYLSPLPRKSIGLLALMPIFFLKPIDPKNGQVNFTLLDVGQGLSAVIQTKNHILVYDTGSRWVDGLSYGETVVLPYLNKIGAKKIDMMMISHGDLDHRGGADYLLSHIPVTTILTSAPHYFPVSLTQICHENESWNWDGVNFTVLYPRTNQEYLDNDSSCVLKVTTGRQSILLPGDIEKKSEHYLVTNEKLSSTILIAPHHGSKTSSTLDFIVATHPQYVLFPVGYLNTYHFPNTAVVSRYKELGAQCLDSVNYGAIYFELFPDRIMKPMSYRGMDRHFWNG